MNTIGKITVLPKLPPAIARLEELAYNLWWSWETSAQDLYARLDPALWEAVNHNPVKMLRSVRQDRLDAAAADPEYLQAYERVLSAFDAYMDPHADTWFRREFPDRQDQVIAYFSAEFGLHEALPIYSGGLGILSGDHCKAASDLGLPFIGVGFLYPQGYFTQRIDAEGRQQAEYEKIDFAEVPAVPARDPQGNEVLVQVELPGRRVFAKVWRIQVGRIPIFLMDTDVENNAPQDRELSARLYGGDREMRISQEVVLGIGGVRAVRALGYAPAVWHMNEGHSAFLGLERVREMVQGQKLSFDEAVEAVRADTLFTTHTPVPAGNDAFAFDLVEKFFSHYWGQLGIDRNRFMDFARQELPWGPQYSMTVLALRLSGFHNGVSRLHGHVSRRMWRFLWPGTPTEQVPIGHITNGVHTKTWLVQELKDLYLRYLGEGWQEQVQDPALWEAVDQIPDQELWAVHQQRKEQLIQLVRDRLQQQMVRHGEGTRRMDLAGQVLNPNALTIGFARRFATYKRATLIFRDIERLKRLLHDPERPIQIIFSGKAHPADEPGKALIQQIYQLSQQPEFQGKIIFLENYDINIARHLISGVDLWLNNPRRPHEASGTSGQKAALSGVPNFSVLDGWWVEGYDGTNGWAIGEEREYKDQETQDEADALSLYSTLENEIIPLFYDRGADGVPHGWVQKMKNAIRTCAPRFSMRRMVIDYVTQYYLPAAEKHVAFTADGCALARELAAWKARMRQIWPSLQLQAWLEGNSELRIGDGVTVEARLRPRDMAGTDVVVEAVYGEPNEEGDWRAPQVLPLEPVGSEGDALCFRGRLVPDSSGQFVLGVRARPHHPQLVHPYEMGLNLWAG
ncbi:alpha-glucan family phosphorylase [Litorilinea aerophila]|uniref:Glycosyltransferase family 1 protein n=1 Tax=Litorilinea aerophila TaxID=1204385 RepID=A0A540V8Y0_9CHLR|nr:alpha-glucan family phosphorylase [Litorilinea aerophila]MCC9078885.1 alpha-glucan family phosphorylase [Litorilinea aerophila]